MARFPGVSMVPVLGFRFQGGRQGLRCFRYSRNQEKQQTEKEFFHGNGAFNLFCVNKSVPVCAFLSSFPFRAVNGKNGIMLHGRELLKLSCFPRRKTARRVENCWKRSGGNCLSALRLPEGPGNIWQERACPRLHIPVAGLVRPGRFLPGCPRPPVPGARVPGRGPFPRRGIAPFWC